MTRVAPLIATALAMLLAPSAARADDVRGDADVYFRGSTDVARDRQIVAIALDARALYAPLAHTLGPAASIDLELGGARPLAFAYGFHVQPLGAGIAIGRMGYLLATTGAGFGGLSDALPFALEIPAAGRLAVDASERVRLVLDGRMLFTPDGRRETRIGIGARLGRTWSEGSFRDAGGYFFRLEHAERLGAAYLGVAIGYELGGAM